MTAADSRAGTTKVAAKLADKPFGRIQLDISPRTHEPHTTDTLAVPNSLHFAGIPAVQVEAIDVDRHAAEKFHGMLRDFGERENPRVRDLLGPVILLEHDLLAPAKTAAVSTGRGLVVSAAAWSARGWGCGRWG